MLPSQVTTRFSWQSSTKLRPPSSLNGKHNRVMPFNLKNVGATYQKVAIVMFHDMIHKEVEVYIDDMIVKSKT